MSLSHISDRVGVTVVEDIHNCATVCRDGLLLKGLDGEAFVGLGLRVRLRSCRPRQFVCICKRVGLRAQILQVMLHQVLGGGVRPKACSIGRIGHDICFAPCGDVVIVIPFVKEITLIRICCNGCCASAVFNKLIRVSGDRSIASRDIYDIKLYCFPLSVEYI